ncbi:hypothetical protein HNR42_002313 [Deinobacterium chartae]|uniref:Uncharacterized protein n=1 Tax=Deinobacterium chartae TaxID=521158 RepID=A0A841I3D4_9DEIO|nr:hypothetical protein [Deinobacterium chartae]MBB6098878.1 hypothetical protein [Deinobacterium chartae]
MSEPLRVWSDTYGCARALYEGLPGGHRWLVAATVDHADTVLQQLSQLPENFKGSLYLILLEDERALPLETALREAEPRGVAVVGADLSGGPAVAREARTLETEGGLSFVESGVGPAWTSALEADGWPEGESLLASTAAAAGYPVISCAPEQLITTLTRWWQRTPLALRVLSASAEVER